MSSAAPALAGAGEMLEGTVSCFSEINRRLEAARRLRAALEASLGGSGNSQ